MPRRRGSRMRRKPTSLSRKQKMEVKKIAEKVVDAEIEDKQQVVIEEKQELFHNKPLYHGKLLASIAQGVNDGDQGTSGGLTTVRIGDQISLKNVNIRFWLSNKLDRPNVIYKGVLYWYPIGLNPGDSEVYKTQTNKVLDRYNNKTISIIDTFIVKPGPMFLNGTEKFEHSYLATLNKSYKNKKVSYDNNTTRAKGMELGFAVVAYDAYGTLQTDNIASFAYNCQLTFQDA